MLAPFGRHRTSMAAERKNNELEHYSKRLERIRRRREAQWSRLSPAQIKAAGQRQHLSARLQEVYAVSPQEAERQIANWQSRQMENPAPARKAREYGDGFARSRQQHIKGKE